MLVVPGLGEHDRADGGGPRRRAARLGLPRLRRPRGDRARHEHAHVDPPGHGPQPRPARRARRRRWSPRPRGSSPTARSGWAAWPTRRRSRPRSRPGWPARGPSPGGACWSAPAGHASRSIPSATSATARAGGWGGRSPMRPAAAAPRSPCSASNVDLPRHPDIRYVDAPTAADLRRAALDAFGSCDVLVMAAAVADFAPAAAREGKIDKGAEGRLALELEPTADILSELAGAPRRAGRGRLRRRARRRGAGARARQARAQAPRPHRPQRRVGRGHRLRQRRQRDHHHRPGRGAGASPA